MIVELFLSIMINPYMNYDENLCFNVTKCNKHTYTLKKLSENRLKTINSDQNSLEILHVHITVLHRNHRHCINYSLVKPRGNY